MQIANGESGFSVRAKINNILSLGTSAQTGTTYTVVAGDEGKLITLNNASPITVTVPSGLGAGFYCLLTQLGAGAVTLTAGGGVTLNSFEDRFEIAGQYGIVTLMARAADSFILAGATV